MSSKIHQLLSLFYTIRFTVVLTTLNSTAYYLFDDVFSNLTIYYCLKVFAFAWAGWLVSQHESNWILPAIVAGFVLVVLDQLISWGFYMQYGASISQWVLFMEIYLGLSFIAVICALLGGLFARLVKA